MTWKLCLFFLAAALSACAAMPSSRLNIAAEKTLPEPSLEKIAEGVWIHKSYEIIEPWGPILSQGLVVEKNGVVFLIDTAWTTGDTKKLLSLIEDQFGRLPYAAIITHAHQDKMGGIAALHEADIETHALRETNDDAKERESAPAQFTIDPQKSYSFFEWPSGLNFYDSNYYPETRWFHVFFPGAGHTRDNIVFYVEPARVLFGGCLIRPGKSKNLGNTADADIANWADAVRKTAAAFPDAEIIIPSHGPQGGRKLLDHTIALAEAANE